MRTLKLLTRALAPALLVAAIAGSANAKVIIVKLKPVLGGTITGTTDFGAGDTVKYEFTVPAPYNFVFSFTDGISFETGGGPGVYIETYKNGAAPSTGGYSLGTSVPEPASWAMMLVGAGAIGAMARRRKAVAAA